MASWRRRPASGTWAAVAGPAHDPGPSPGQRLFLQQQEYSGGLVLPPGAPETEEEYVQYLQERILSSQETQLYPLKEDLAEWLNKTLDIDYITPENFLDALDNGMVVCRLAQVIQDKAQQAIEAGRFPGPAPSIRSRFWEHAARRSFFCRDNMENFIKFCRKLGVHENLLFESDDLVLHSGPRSVVLCLLEVSRLAARFDVEPPGLVQLEKEIAQQEEREATNWRHSIAVAPRSSSSAPKMRHSSSSSAISAGGRWGGSTSSSPGPRSATRSSDRPRSMDGHLRRARSEGGAKVVAPGIDDDMEWASSSGRSSSGAGASEWPPAAADELDRRISLQVQQVAGMTERQCQCQQGRCSRLKVKKLGEGKYNIAGRNVFVRLLKGRHMMVRVGGGWDTLEHFLLRHDTSCGATGRNASSYLHVRAKYRSPPPDGVAGC